MEILIGVIIGLFFALDNYFVFEREKAILRKELTSYRGITLFWKTNKALFVGGLVVFLHFVSPTTWIGVIVSLCFYYVTFETLLNVFRGLHPFYVTEDKSSSKIDNFKRFVFGKQAQTFEAVLKISILIIALILYIYEKF